MQAYVLPDPRLRKLAGRFVWLSVDTEKPVNRAFVERFPIDAWPTLLVIDPATQEVVVRWAGTATAADIERLALDGERSVKAVQASRADTLLAEADRLVGAREHQRAAGVYREALTAGGPGWSGRERAVEARLQALGWGDDPAACVAAAREGLPAVKTPAIAARVVAQGLACAGGLEGEPQRTAYAALEPRGRELLRARGVLAEDRSFLYDLLANAREAAGDAAGERRTVRAWLAFLEQEAAKGKTPLERAAFHGQRVNAAVRLGEPRRVLRALEASEKELPDDYVVPTLLGVVYLELDRPADALAAADRALSRAQGPRRVRVMVLQAQALQALGRIDDARARLVDALAEGEALPENARPRAHLAKARKMLDEL